VSRSAYISRFILCVLTFLPVYAYFTCCHPSGVVVLRNFRLSQRCCWRFPHSWLGRLGDFCIDNSLWEERNVGPYTSTYTASRPEWRESGSLLLLLQPSCLLRHRNSGGASHHSVVCWTSKIIGKISSGVIDYVEFTKAFFTFRLSYGSRYTHKCNFKDTHRNSTSLSAPIPISGTQLHPNRTVNVGTEGQKVI